MCRPTCHLPHRLSKPRELNHYGPLDNDDIVLKLFLLLKLPRLTHFSDVLLFTLLSSYPISFLLCKEGLMTLSESHHDLLLCPQPQSDLFDVFKRDTIGSLTPALLDKLLSK
jgi:hypothetical protein